MSKECTEKRTEEPQNVEYRMSKEGNEKRTEEPQNNEPQPATSSGRAECRRMVSLRSVYFYKMERFPPASHRRGGGLSPPGNVGNLSPDKLAALLGGDKAHR
jgi:hypothetical protein